MAPRQRCGAANTVRPAGAVCLSGARRCPSLHRCGSRRRAPPHNRLPCRPGSPPGRRTGHTRRKTTAAQASRAGPGVGFDDRRPVIILPFHSSFCAQEFGAKGGGAFGPRTPAARWRMTRLLTGSTIATSTSVSRSGSNTAYHLFAFRSKVRAGVCARWTDGGEGEACHFTGAFL